ncbi:cation transporter [Pseudoflavonifractor sp. 60]|uniref:cation diffusion facilitator family transporter n=1 Tax=Pseudoflavonifractor sp. 60 TaxID=2304576 RepID=UPI0013695B3E|nr:cation diffusion facilitator family transporter [Pseudoflavonifractor sp. 60]NBI65499.1 cation transporter [Pseudoflavonifractor sp. 60]
MFLRLCLGRGDPQAPETRRRCGVLSGGIGIALNLLLFLGKLLAGIVTASIAITADAFNNLSDAASSVVTLIGFRLASQEADEEHPFGHGRIEYLAGLVVALLILLVGFELAQSSLQKILYPDPVVFSPLPAGILALSVGVKLWMFAFNRALARSIDSPALAATAADSLSDTAGTAAVLLGLAAGGLLQLPLDGWLGLAVALFILHTGWEAAKDTVDPLLGRPMDSALAADIDRIVLGHDCVLGIHDLVYHDYGPGRAMMSLHVEVPADGNFLELHDIIDHIERELKVRHHIETCIHMDPVVRDQRTNALRDQIAALARELDPACTIHDFRITAGPIHTNLIFDVVVPYNFPLSDNQVRAALYEGIKELSDRYFAVIQVDHSFVEERNKS